MFVAAILQRKEVIIAMQQQHQTKPVPSSRDQLHRLLEEVAEKQIRDRLTAVRAGQEVAKRPRPV